MVGWLFGLFGWLDGWSCLGMSVAYSDGWSFIDRLVGWLVCNAWVHWLLGWLRDWLVSLVFSSKFVCLLVCWWLAGVGFACLVCCWLEELIACIRALEEQFGWLAGWLVV